MAEAKNSFLKGKMNKDVDNRLLPNGEYRDALNISVGKSESQSVGSLQNILGNYQLRKQTPTGSEVFESNTNLVCIGSFVDNENNRIYQFLTDYQDPNPSDINLPPAGSQMKVTVYDPSNTGNPYLTLLEGTYLNFSITNLITGVNLVENLLFWTDNRNQPRKINVDNAISNPFGSPTQYYTNVDQISVAKYAPFKAPELYSFINLISVSGGVIPHAGQSLILINTIELTSKKLEVGDQLICNGVTVGDSAIVTNIGPDNGSGQSPVYISGLFSIPYLTELTFYKCMMSKNSLESTVNGNDNFLADKFVRFSYRFKYDDNEYSIMAPFTQPAFIPEQKGYFVNGNEDAAYRSTVLEWMQNDVNAVSLLIELPDTGGNIEKSYKVKTIDILYKESDSNAVKVIQSVDVSVLALESLKSNIYKYTYNSQKPRKTLPEADTVRVYDKIPIRALSQESVGNRIIYGNFVNQNTPPKNLDYNILVLEKDEPFTSWVEYPNHTLKQNRTYQVGVVLADKFGRQSSVILSSASPYSTGGDLVFGASSVFFPYKNENWSTDVINWVGDQLALVFNTQITSNRDENLGTPGLYATVSGSISGSTDGFQITSGTITGTLENIYTFTLEPIPAQRNVPLVGNYLRGKYVDYVKVTNIPTSGTVITDGAINDIYLYDVNNIPDIKYSYSINELGWYSYKVVVKQQEQEYYNVYIPGMLSGYPKYQSFATTPTVQYTMFPTNEEQVTCHFVSINDNINKIPRDLSEVGPNQRQYRSSAQIWPRVQNTLVNIGNSSTAYTTNIQYYPKGQPDVVNTIAPTTDLNFLMTSDDINPKGSASYNLYQFETSPLINRVSTQQQVGVVGNAAPGVSIPTSFYSMSPFLGVYETQPFTSTLDIFWETSTSGYISDLNTDIASGSDAIVSYSPLEFTYYEFQKYNGNIINPTGSEDSPWITNWFYFKNSSGVPVYAIDNIIFSVKRRNGEDCTQDFALVKDVTPGSPTEYFWRIKITNSEIYFGTNVDSYGSFIFTFAITHTVGAVTYTPIITTESEILKVSNNYPIITSPVSPTGTYWRLTSDPLVGPVVDCIGKNGSIGNYSGNYQNDLYWDTNPGSTVITGNFKVDSANGDISVLTNSVPIGDNVIAVRLRDACTSAGLQTGGGLSTVKPITLNVTNWRIGCGEWSSVTALTLANKWTNTTSGYISIWRALRKNETLLSNNSYIISWKEYNTNIVHPLYPNEWPIYFATVAVGGTPGSLKGGFNKQLYTEVTNQTTTRVAISLKIQVNLITSTGRNISFVFDSNSNITTPFPAGVWQQAFSHQCTVPTFEYPEVYPQPYDPAPNDCYNWKIINTSSFPIPWSGLHGNTREIIGGVLSPGQQVGTPINGGTQPLVKHFSLQAAGNNLIGGMITYTGSALACPV